MEPTPHQIFGGLEPYRVVSDLKLPLVKRDGAFFTPHPQYPEHELQVEATEFVGLGYNSPTPGCNVFDFLALRFGLYEQAVDHVIEHYFNLARMPAGITLASARDHWIAGLKSERKQFEDILNLQAPFRHHSEKLISTYIDCRRLGILEDHAWRMFYVASAEELNYALHFATEPFDAPQLGEHYRVFPYFKNYHAFAVLQIAEANGKPVRSVRLAPGRFMFFGLHSCLPGNRETRVFGTRQETLEMHSYAMKNGDFQVGFLHVLFDPKAAAIAPSRRKAVFVVTDKSDFNLIAQNQMAFERLDIAAPADRYDEMIEPVPWSQYALGRIIQALNEDRTYSPRVSAIVASIQSDPVLFARLVSHLEKQNQGALLEEIRKRNRPLPLVSEGDLDILQMATGYATIRSNASVPSQLTNFLIEITCSIWFEDSQDIYFAGRLVVNGAPIWFLISEQDTLQPRSILAQARRAANQAGLRTETPNVIDPTLQNHLVRILALQLADKPKFLGVQRLGWNANKTRFVSPAWEGQSSGLQATSKTIHPQAKMVGLYFSTRDYSTGTDFSKVTPQGRYLVAILAALISRGFLNQPTPTVSLLRSVQSLVLLQAIFRPLGQRTPIELSSDRRMVLRTLSPRNFSGYPLYATCSDVSALENLGYPMFLIGTSGLALNAPLDCQVLAQIGDLSHQVVTSLVVSLLREPLQAHSLITNQPDPSHDDLAAEGRRIIELNCGLGRFDLAEPELPLLQTVLSRIPPDKVRDYFHYDPTADLIRIRCRGLPEVTRMGAVLKNGAKNAF